MHAELAHISPEGLRQARFEIERRNLAKDHLAFTRRLFVAAEGNVFQVSPHHRLICKQLDRIFTGDCKRLIINQPPGTSKTELAVINLVARGFAVNPKARFIHTSYSDKLVNDNSVKIKNVIGLEEYQKRWEVAFKADSSAKGLWRTTAGGHFLASPAGGSITGFRAGYLNARHMPENTTELEDYELTNMNDEQVFTGAFLIDDPLKPDDAFSEVTRQHINSRWHSTFKSRLAHPNIPVVVTMQRLHIDDFTHHLLDASGEEWEVLCLPAIIDGPVDPPHPNAIMIPHGLEDGLLWETKLPQKDLDTNKLEEMSYHAQYMQSPIVQGGNIFKESMFGYYDPEKRPDIKRRLIFADTASKTKERNDYSVFGVFGLDNEGSLYILDWIRGKWEAPELVSVAIKLYAKHSNTDAFPIARSGYLESINVEDASSGIMLIQQLQRMKLPVKSIKVETDKYSKARGTTPSIAVNPVLLPEGAPWIRDFLTEMYAFPEGVHDDQCDVLMGGVQQLLINGASMFDNY